MTPSKLLSISEMLPARAAMKRIRSSLGEETRPVLGNISPMPWKVSLGMPYHLRISTALANWFLGTATAKRFSFTGRFVAEMPRAMRSPSMVLASLSVTFV